MVQVIGELQLECNNSSASASATKIVKTFTQIKVTKIERKAPVLSNRRKGSFNVSFHGQRQNES